MLQKNEQFGDPFHSSYQGTMFSKTYEDLVSNISTNTKTSASEYIENEGILNFLNNFIFSGIIKSLSILSALSFPYLFILLPFGILFSFRALVARFAIFLYRRERFVFFIVFIYFPIILFEFSEPFYKFTIYSCWGECHIIY